MNNSDILGKILAVQQIILKHPYGITTNQIIAALDNEYGIKAERKSIYNNIAALTRFFPIFTEKKGNKVFYFCKRSDAYGGLPSQRR